MWTPGDFHLDVVHVDGMCLQLLDFLKSTLTSLILLMLGATSSELPVGRLIIVGDHTHCGGVVHKLDDGVWLVFGQTVVGGEGINYWVF